VNVVQNVSPGATSWPGSPIISTVADPASDTVAEGFNGGGGNTNLSETFTVTTTNYVLQTIDIYVAAAGQGTGPGANVTLNLYDLGSQTAPNPSPYTQGILYGNLFGSGAGLPITYSSQPDGVLEFDFTGADQVILQAGHMYAFELTGVINTQPINWYRGITDTYSGGAAYRNQSWINAISARDFSLAIYATNTSMTVSNPPISGVSTVDWNNVHQRIDGFGASSAWNGSWTTTEADLLFSTNNNISYLSVSYHGIGLSLLRNRIANSGSTSASALPTTVETSIMQMAQARGARVWSTPWTPPTGFKSTNDTYDTLPITNAVNGGTFLGSGNNITNLNYASQLANYVASMKTTYGINLYAISIQNEPDAEVNTYDACQWTGAQIHDFATNLFNALTAKGYGSTKIILPESQNWSDPKGFASTAMSDPNVAADVGIVADHNYDGNNGPSSLVKNSYGKPLWETEVAMLSGNDPSITNGVYYGQRIYLFMTQAQANAYHYWWLIDTVNGGLLDYPNSPPTKRMFVFGQYSRFVRPNFYRIDATSSQASALVSAYKDSASPAFAIVAVNISQSYSVTQTFNLTNYIATSVTPWVTSATLSLAPQTAVNVTNGSFTYTLPALSVVTFVGQGITSAPPVFVSVPNQTVNAGVTVQVTNTATASDVPPYSLTYSAANAFPTNATLNPTSGVFNWRPSVSQANTTNLIQVLALDSDPANLSATNSFSVIVNPLTNPVVSAAGAGGNVSFGQGQFSMAIAGPQGPDYTLLMSTDLVTWQSIFTTNSPVMPFTFTDPNATNPNQFYQIQIGP
jgi:glucuronoarabinoxylan endo-1,4-beta-xylanase